MTITSIDIDAAALNTARRLTGAVSNEETVSLALKTLIAVRCQPAAIDRIIARHFTDDQIDSSTAEPGASRSS